MRLFRLVRGRRRAKRLRVVAGVSCWCKAFGSKWTACYCVGFDAPKSEQDGVK